MRNGTLGIRNHLLSTYVNDFLKQVKNLGEIAFSNCEIINVKTSNNFIHKIITRFKGKRKGKESL